MIEAVRSNPHTAAPLLLAELSPAWEAFLGAGVALLGSSGFWAWWNRRKRNADLENFRASAEAIRIALEGALANAIRQAEVALSAANSLAERERQISDRERQIGDDFKRLYEERRKELHAANNANAPLMTNYALLLLESGKSREEVNAELEPYFARMRGVAGAMVQ